MNHPTPTATRRLRGLAALALAVGLALTGCSTGNSSDASTGASSAETTRVETAFGAVDIPATPKRVIALEGAVGPLLEAGITPLATADGDFEDSFLPAEYATSKDLPVILTPDGWDYEKIASLKPDLLVGFVRGGTDQKISDQSRADWEKLSKIAPTVFILSEGAAQTKEATLQVSEILGRGETAEETKATYETEAARIKDEYAEALARTTFAPVDYYEGVTTVYSPISWLGGIITDAGGRLVPLAAKVTDMNGADLSSEQLGQLSDATVILTEETVAGEPGVGAVELAAVPTYQQLPAVTAGNAYGIRYFFADRYETGLEVLKQLEQILKQLG